MQLTVDGRQTTTDPVLLPDANSGTVSPGADCDQSGGDPAWYTMTLSGVPVAQQPPAQSGFTISRRYYTRAGKDVDPGQIHQNDLLVVVITGEAQGSEAQQALVVDLLPAGLEIENARLAHNTSTTEIAWLPELTQTLNTEFRDDRFAAALDLDAGGKRKFTLAYLARAVTPGVYRQPAVFVEDMYKPWQFGRGAMGTVKIE